MEVWSLGISKTKINSFLVLKRINGNENNVVTW